MKVASGVKTEKTFGAEWNLFPAISSVASYSKSEFHFVPTSRRILNSCQKATAFFFTCQTENATRKTEVQGLGEPNEPVYGHRVSDPLSKI